MRWRGIPALGQVRECDLHPAPARAAPQHQQSGDQGCSTASAVRRREAGHRRRHWGGKEPQIRARSPGQVIWGEPRPGPDGLRARCFQQRRSRLVTAPFDAKRPPDAAGGRASPPGRRTSDAPSGAVTRSGPVTLRCPGRRRPQAEVLPSPARGRRDQAGQLVGHVRGPDT